MVDLSEEPRWGRVAESLGETPVLSGRLAAALVRGFQGDDVSDPDRLAACAKHFAGYGLAAGGRDYDTVSVGENTLRNLHLRPFKAAVDAGVSDGHGGLQRRRRHPDARPPSTSSATSSRASGASTAWSSPTGTAWASWSTPASRPTCARPRRRPSGRGVDLDMCSGAYLAHLEELVESGDVDLALVDDAVRRVLRLKFRLGLFERPYAARPGASNAPTPETREVALRAGQAAHVLVKNDGVLPLDASRTRPARSC